MIATALICILTSLIIFGLLMLKKKRQYFKDKNIKYLPPNLILGNSTEVVRGRLHQSEVIGRLYRAFPEEKVVGHFEFTQPMLVIRSPDLVSAILTKDFSHFHDRIAAAGEVSTPADANLFILTGNTWRAVRQRFSPLFTAGKLKFMFQTMADCADNLCSYLDEKDGQEVDMTDVMMRYAMEIIGSTVFGIDTNVQKSQGSQFEKMGMRVFPDSLVANVKTMIRIFAPKLAKIFGIKGLVDPEVSNYFLNVITSTMQQRKMQGTERNDFVQMLLQLKEKGKVELQIHDSGDNYLIMDKTADTIEIELTDNILVGGAFTFLVAGFHATAMTIAFTMCELAQHPDIVARLREEIREHAPGGRPTYDQLKNMVLLDRVMKESLRLHPTAATLIRHCTKEYTCPDGLVISRGQDVMIPVSSIHRDPAYWSEPETFQPDRFQDDWSPVPGTYLPFGDGARMCIAMRFAQMEIKYAIVELIRRYDFKLSEKTRLPLKLKARVALQTPEGGITFQVKKIRPE